MTSPARPVDVRPAKAPPALPLVLWLPLHGLRPASLGADIPLAAVLRTRILALGETPPTWTWTGAAALARHRDFEAAPGNAQHLYPPAGDHTIVAIWRWYASNRTALVRMLRHELWHLNNRAADVDGDPFHEPHARAFEVPSNRVPWALFPPDTRNPRAVR